jgi:hypothetical protein
MKLNVHSPVTHRLFRNDWKIGVIEKENSIREGEKYGKGKKR